MNGISILRSLQLYILYGILFLFPLFFLPITQDSFAFQKLYLIIVGLMVISVIELIRIIIEKKITVSSRMIDWSVFLLIAPYGASIIIASPNKMQALFALPSGLASWFFLIALYHIITQLQPAKAWVMMQTSVFFLSMIVIGAFLMHVTFSPLGNYIETGVFIGLFILLLLLELIQSPYEKRKMFISVLLLLIYSTACIISVRSMLQDKIIPSYRISFDTARFTLTKPASSFFGAGVDNYSALFTKAKARVYNDTPLWDVTFTHGRSFMLDLWAETGLFGLSLFLLFIVGVFHYCNRIKARLLMVYIVLMLFLFPASLALLFLFFTTTSLVIGLRGQAGKKMTRITHFFPAALYMFVSSLLLFFILYVLVRAYRAEYHYHQGLISASRNQGQNAYRHLQKAIMFNPYNESFRIRFAQFYLLIAQNKAEKKEEKISKDDTHIIAQAIESILKQAKAAPALNPYKAMNWENLGDMYTSIIGSVNGADVWAVASYQRAIQADPLSPRLRLKSGGVYYRVHNYAEAKKYFHQAIVLKHDWSNAHYNLAWVLFQEKKYQEAVSELEKTRTLLPSNSAEFQKTTKELVEFKKYL